MKIINPVDLKGNKATNAADPVDGQDLATKNYVDSQVTPQQVFVQQTRPTETGPWTWYQLDSSGNLIDLIIHIP